MDAKVRPRRVIEREWADLVAWLDGGLRRGERGRLQGEYPISLRAEHAARHRVVADGDSYRAHAMFHCVTAQVDGSALPLGLISLVYTEPTARGQGLASLCVEACVEGLREEGAALALLWTDRPAFYERLGFHAVGQERLLALDSRHLRLEPGEAEGFDVGDWREDELPALERMYLARSIRADREPGALGRLLAGPGVEALVARDANGPQGYAVLGRGDDFPGIVHEWAGAGDAVLACLARFGQTREVLGMLAGPRDEGPLPRLLAAGAGWHANHFGMARLLDPAGLFRASTRGASPLTGLQVRGGEGSAPPVVEWSGERGHARVSEADTLRLILGGPDARPAHVLEGVCSEDQRKVLGALWPWPLYLWGFDSI